MSDLTYIVGMPATLRPRFRQAFNAAEQLVNAGEDIEIIIRLRKSKRSADQNRRYWAMLRDIAGSVWVAGRQYQADVWHEQYARWFIGTEDLVMPDGSRQTRAISTSALSVSQFSDYMTRIEAWCAEHGYPIGNAA